MSGPAALTADAADLEALFDSIVSAQAAPATPPPAAASPAASPAAGGAAEAGSGSADEVLTRVGKLTRDLHDSLRALGYDRALQDAASSMPDTRDRLTYVVTMTEKAAERALNATEKAKPIQDKLAADAGRLSRLWDGLYARELSVDQFRELAAETRQFLQGVPAQAGATNAQLTEVMMAQDFQDLTGQVIRKVTELAHDLEGKLLHVLVENAVPAKREEAGKLLNGPVINAAGRADIVANQQQVDELLESLGF